MRPTRIRDKEMKQTDINRIRYEVERQVYQAIDRELEELKRRFVKKANQYHQILFSEEAINIVDNTYGPKYQRLDNIRLRLKIKETENKEVSKDTNVTEESNKELTTNLNETTVNLDNLSEQKTTKIYEEEDDDKFFDDFFSDE